LNSGDARRAELRWVIGASLGVVALTFVPYLYDRMLQGASPLYGWYSWYAFNTTDNCVYLSWMRQYADGSWFHRNLFTTAAQSGRQINLFYLLLGRTAGLTGVPPVVLYHVARGCATFALLLLVWRLASMFIADLRARRCAFLMVCFSAGLGWLPGLWERGFAGPIDLWQPEAITFLSVYLFPLFAVSLALMLGVLVNLLEAERTRSLKPALWAGLWAFLLGNIHTYDVITLALVWCCCRPILVIAARPSAAGGRPDRGGLARAAVAGLPAVLSSGHMFWVFKTEAVFAQRVAVPTLTPSPVWVLAGYGLLAPLALVGVRALWRADDPEQPNSSISGVAFLSVWVVANVAAAYLPVTFQRKLLMGAHIPIALLAGAGLAWLTKRLSGRWWPLAVSAAVVLLGLTNVRFLARDRGALRYGGESVRAYMLPGERAAVEWIRRNAAPGAVVQPLPWVGIGPDGRPGFADTTVACFVPGLTGHAVDAGHWGETPDFGQAMGRWVRFVIPDTPDEWRRDLLRTSGVRYLIFSQKRAETRDDAVAGLLSASPIGSPPPYLRRVESACNEDADVWEVMGL